VLPSSPKSSIPLYLKEDSRDLGTRSMIRTQGGPWHEDNPIDHGLVALRQHCQYRLDD